MLFKRKKEFNDSRILLITAGYLNISVLLRLQNFPLVHTNKYRTLYSHYQLPLHTIYIVSNNSSRLYRKQWKQRILRLIIIIIRKEAAESHWQIAQTFHHLPQHHRLTTFLLLLLLRNHPFSLFLFINSQTPKTNLDPPPPTRPLLPNPPPFRPRHLLTHLNPLLFLVIQGFQFVFFFLSSNCSLRDFRFMGFCYLINFRHEWYYSLMGFYPFVYCC